MEGCEKAVRGNPGGFLGKGASQGRWGIAVWVSDLAVISIHTSRIGDATKGTPLMRGQPELLPTPTGLIGITPANAGIRISAQIITEKIKKEAIYSENLLLNLRFCLSTLEQFVFFFQSPHERSILQQQNFIRRYQSAIVVDAQFNSCIPVILIDGLQFSFPPL